MKAIRDLFSDPYAIAGCMIILIGAAIAALVGIGLAELTVWLIRTVFP